MFGNKLDSFWNMPQFLGCTQAGTSCRSSFLPGFFDMLPTKYASFFKRLIAHVIDVMLASLIAGILVFPLILLVVPVIFARMFSFHGWSYTTVLDPELFVETLLGSLPVHLLMLMGIVFSILYWLYFAIFESSPRQATPGKMLAGIFVTDLTGGRISFWRALGRTLGKVLSKALLYLGYLLALFTERNQALHDLLAGTLVLEPDYIALAQMYAPAAETQGRCPEADAEGKQVPPSSEVEGSLGV